MLTGRYRLVKHLIFSGCLTFMLGCADTLNQAEKVKLSDLDPSDIRKSKHNKQPDDNTEAPADTTDPNSHDSKLYNILLVIADDLGIDALSIYDLSNDTADTPTLASLADNGITFTEAWATPMCTTTRATLLTGQFGFHSGVTYVPAPLSNDAVTLQAYLSDHLSANFSQAVFGKWHVGGGSPALDHPQQLGIPHYAGNLAGNLESYFDWALVINGEQKNVSDYHTTKITDLAIDWIHAQTTPWFAWVAYSAPHTPWHAPPKALHQQTLLDTADDKETNPKSYYKAAIEAMDTEIGRLVNSLPSEQKDNTLIIFLGDNGSPRAVIDTAVFPREHGKKSIYEGGIRVPFIVAGNPVAQPGRASDALINTVDLFATIGEIQGLSLSNYEDSQSLAKHILQGADASRTLNYAEFEINQTTSWATRNDRYKFIAFPDASEALFDLAFDVREETNLIDATELQSIITELKNYGLAIRTQRESASTSNDISNRAFTNLSPNCEDYKGSYGATVKDIATNKSYSSTLSISSDDAHCIFTSNSIPNHDFNDGNRVFPNTVAEVTETFRIKKAPSLAQVPTPLSLQVDNAILLNGVKVDVLAAGCYGIGNGKVGCNDMRIPWRYDPMHAANGFNVDTNNAHTQPDGGYHYHGPPSKLYGASPLTASGVIGFAADGFPIYGPYFEDNGEIKLARTSYRLKSGSRPDGPSGDYDGQFRDDYEYINGLGDLDECNGMTLNGQYGYYVTAEFPYILGCFSGTPDPSFNKH